MTDVEVWPCAVANVKGAYSEIVQEGEESHMPLIEISSEAPDGDYLIDIAFGPAAAESTVINNHPFNPVHDKDIPTLFPMIIPKGTRVSVRTSSPVAGAPALKLRFSKSRIMTGLVMAAR